ncbi:MAG TPA: hypothetical protein VEC39_18005 [Vicinamibacterales bacterium]|nr:hypothetical protein [Vicinamibacterales bacterium]
MIAGINYPWTMFQGRPNYGCDFGRNRWNSHAGVTRHLDEVRADFHTLASARIEVVRWFVFGDGRGGLAWGGDGELRGIDESFFDDMDAAVEIAASANVRLCLVLLDFAWLDDVRRIFALESRAFGERVLEPFLERYGNADAIHSYDIINEPDWRPAWPVERLREFVGDASSRIHARSTAQVTLGGARVSRVKEWDDPAYGLDIIQVHSYPDVRDADREDWLFGRSAASFGLTKPLLIGECPWHPRVHPDGHLSPVYTLAEYVKLARDGGYLGVWPWSFKGVDAFGAIDLSLGHAG